MIRLQADAGRVSVLHVYTPTVTTASTEVPESGLELAWVIANACVCLLCLHRCFRVQARPIRLCLQVFQSASAFCACRCFRVQARPICLCLQVFQSASAFYACTGVSECKQDRYVCACRCFRVQARPISPKPAMTRW